MTVTNTSSGLKLISLNIEGHKHLHQRVIPFLRDEQPDVVCLQEVFEDDVPVVEQALRMKGFYKVSAYVNEKGYEGKWGVLQLTHLPVTEQKYAYYFGEENKVPSYTSGDYPNVINRVFLWSVIEFAGQPFTIGTSHFTWSHNGDATEEQFRDLAALQKVLDRIPELVFCGDFNAPRGRETFARLAARYTDHIPPEVTTSIDGQFHRAGQLQLMVDVLFSTPEYQVSNVEMVAGLSDHQGIRAIIRKA